MISLPLSHVNEVCKLGQGIDQCRWLAFDENKVEVFFCLKISPIHSRIVEEEINAYRERTMKSTSTHFPPPPPLGDNCDGYSNEPAVPHVGPVS